MTVCPEWQVQRDWALSSLETESLKYGAEGSRCRPRFCNAPLVPSLSKYLRMKLVRTYLTSSVVGLITGDGTTTDHCQEAAR